MKKLLKVLPIVFVLNIVFSFCGFAGAKFGVYKTIEDYKNDKIWWVESYHCDPHKGEVQIKEDKKWTAYKTEEFFAFTNDKGQLSRHVEYQKGYWYEVAIFDYMPGIYYWYADFGNGTGASYISTTEFDSLYRFDKKADIEKLSVHPEFKTLLDCCRAEKKEPKQYLNLIWTCLRNNTAVKRVDGRLVYPTNKNKSASGSH